MRAQGGGNGETRKSSQAQTVFLGRVLTLLVCFLPYPFSTSSNY